MPRPHSLKKSLIVVAASLALAGAAFGAAHVGSIDDIARWMKGGFFAGKTAVTSASNQVTGAWAPTTCDYDFPSTANGYCTVARDKTCSVPGVKLGDPCFIGVMQASPADGGSAWWVGGELLTAVGRANDVVELQLCNRIGDAGALDVPDAGYSVRCLSNQ